MTQALPKVMVAPNGARRTKSDHPALPIGLQELVDTAIACRKVGAGGIHLHVRDGDGLHSLDVGLYRELLAEVKQAIPGFFLQVTSEAAGRFGPEEQMQMIRRLRPASVSLALSELMRAPTTDATARAFYSWAVDEGVCIHHIAYTPDELGRFLGCVDSGIIPGDSHQLQLVLGSYAATETSTPSQLDAYQVHLDARRHDLALDWMVCAFGSGETACLVETARRGGKMRVGFENSLWNADGSVAEDNAARVTDLLAALDASPEALTTEDR